MRVQLAQQAQEILGQSDLVIITERVDDVALLIGQMVQMGLPEVLDRHIPRHWTQRGISWGWTAVIWLAYIVTEGDHRKVSMETYLTGMRHTLRRLTAQVIEPLDFSDDRLSHLLKHLSKPAYWHQIEHDLNARSIEVYDLAQDVIRCDATTVSGDHEVTEEGLVQFGHSKDDPARPQIKVMMGSLDPLGMPLATDVLSGERADDGLYIPIIERIRTGLKTPGLLFVGDCKMSALDTRAYLARHQDWYLSPLPLTGATAEAMDAWITAGVTQGEAGALAQIWRTNDRGHEVLAAEGYEFERTCHAPGDAADAAAWHERVLVVRSPMHADQQAAGLEKRLCHAETKLAALTPERSGQTANHRRSDARGGDCRRAQRASGGRLAQRDMGKAGRADHPICRPGARLGAPRDAGDPENPLPHHPYRAPGRHHRHAPSTFWLEGLCYQCDAQAAVFAGGGVVLSQRIPC